MVRISGGEDSIYEESIKPNVKESTPILRSGRVAPLPPVKNLPPPENLPPLRNPKSLGRLQVQQKTEQKTEQKTPSSAWGEGLSDFGVGSPVKTWGPGSNRAIGTSSRVSPVPADAEEAPVEAPVAYESKPRTESKGDHSSTPAAKTKVWGLLQPDAGKPKRLLPKH